METNKNAVIGLIASLREHYNKFLEAELKSHNMKGLLNPHGSILACLYKNEGKMQVLEIAKKLGRSKSSISELVDRLVDLGYVEKKSGDEDRRVTYVVLTKKGISIRADFDEISRNLIDTAYNGFSEDEKEALVNSLEKMRSNFQNRA